MNQQQFIAASLSNSPALLLEQARELAIIQDKKHSPSEKAQMLKQHELNTIIEYCESTSCNIDFLTSTLGKLLLERLHIPSQTLLLENQDMLQFAGILNTLLASLKTSISTIENSSKVIVGCYR
ncbi:hypothetical protein [Snodgrassella alvi]|uniref:hypothetical protein n=1 Tax=Snodgrassella alvi TaxID=1196083 RepID=UPI000C1DFBCC|nr:hypothetical protein [Snodgrassella alvi]PIT16762.1 hypothetical protein BGI33_03630 [Snodgrassella alvi]PIT16986.1 hypothetical protein BGI34_08090 [Snodgrassella alvi]